MTTYLDVAGYTTNSFLPSPKAVELFDNKQLLKAFHRTFGSRTEMKQDDFRSGGRRLFYTSGSAQLMLKINNDSFELDYDIKGKGLVFKAVYEKNPTAMKRSYYWKSDDLKDSTNVRLAMTILCGTKWKYFM